MKKLEDMSPKELQDLAQKAAALAVEKREAGKKALRDELVKRIQEAGYSVGEIFPAAGAASEKPARRPRSSARSDLPAQYQHPENPALTWTGRGRKPNWLNEWLESGRTLEEAKVAA